MPVDFTILMWITCCR